MLTDQDKARAVAITAVCVNYRGETSTRKLLPIRVFYGSDIYHPKICWRMEVLDVEKNEKRIFPLTDLRFE